MNPDEPMQLGSTELNGAVERLKPMIEQVWGRKMWEMPKVEIVAPENILEQINYHEDLSNKMFGYGGLSKVPRTVYLDEPQKVLVLPSACVFTKIRGTQQEVSFSDPGTFSDLEVVTAPWDRLYFERILAEMMSNVIARQARNEWGDDYVRSMKAVGPNAELRIYEIVVTCARIANERLCVQYPQLGFYVGADAMKAIWMDAWAQRVYIGLDALSQSKTLARAVMIDQLGFTDTSGIFIAFDRGHPFYFEKSHAFDSE
jgi:hypothetical protein